MHNCSREQIEVRAYQLWQERGRARDTPEIDWLNAEAELRAAEPTFSRVARRFGAVLGSMVGTVKARARASVLEKHTHPSNYHDDVRSPLGRPRAAAVYGIPMTEPPV